MNSIIRVEKAANRETYGLESLRVDLRPIFRLCDCRKNSGISSSVTMLSTRDKRNARRELRGWLYLHLHGSPTASRAAACAARCTEATERRDIQSVFCMQWKAYSRIPDHSSWEKYLAVTKGEPKGNAQVRLSRASSFSFSSSYSIERCVLVSLPSSCSRDLTTHTGSFRTTSFLSLSLSLLFCMSQKI